MRKFLTILSTAIISFGLGFLFALPAPRSEGAPPAPSADIPAAAQRMWFPPVDQYDTGGEPLSDESFDELMAAFDVAMTAEETLADFDREASVHLWSFARRLAIPEVTDEQRERISSYMDALIEQHPDGRATIEERVSLIDAYSASMPSAPGFAGSLLLFGDADEYDVDGEPFDDAQVDRLIATLDALLALPEVAEDLAEEAVIPFWRFGNRLQQGRINEEQTARIVAYMEGVKENHPDAAEMVDKQLYLVENLIPGQVAPNIMGTDTEGVDFALEDYRGKIVALVFSGHWCGPCRGEYPYQRAMLDLFEEDDVVLLGVNSDAELETIVEAKKEERLAYRTWWDGHAEEAAKGPIASAWNVVGWPSIYVLDEEGVIRFVNKRGGALIGAVDELLMDKRVREFKAEREAEAETETMAS